MRRTPLSREEAERATDRSRFSALSLPSPSTPETLVRENPREHLLFRAGYVRLTQPTWRVPSLLTPTAPIAASLPKASRVAAEQFGRDASASLIRSEVEAYLRAPEDEARGAALTRLAELAETYGDAVRQALCYVFSSESTPLGAVREEFARSVSVADADEVFDSLASHAKVMLSRHQDRVVIINATFRGGGVAEMFQTAAQVLQQVGITVEWHRTYVGRQAAYDEAGRRAFDAFQGGALSLTPEDIQVWGEENKRLGRILGSVAQDPRVAVVFLEDHHPIHLIGLLKARNPNLRIIWRSHVDNAGLLSERPAATALWRDVMLPELRHLSASDSVLFQPGSVPPDAALLTAGIFQQAPGIDLFSPKNRPLVRAGQEVEGRIKRNQVLARIAPSLNPAHPYLVAGGRFVAWKGLLPILRAFGRIADTYEDINLLIFGTVGTGDPRKSSYKKLLDGQLRMMIRERPGLRARIVMVVDENEHINTFYDLAAEHHMPYLHFSLREGYGMMPDEASRQGAMIISSLVGGLSRFASDVTTGPSQLDLSELAAHIADPTKLYVADPETGEPRSTGWVTDAIERAEAEHLSRLLSARRRDPAAFARRYRAEASRAHVMTLLSCLTAMSRDYAAYAAADAASIQRARHARQPGETASPSWRLTEMLRGPKAEAGGL